MSGSSPQYPVWRKILGVFLGLSVAITVISLLQALGYKLWPLPEGLDVTNKDAMAEVLKQAPAAALVWVALTWFAGTFAGSYIALRVSKDVWAAWPAVTVEAVLLTFGVLTLLTYPHPGWFWVLGLISFPLGAFAGIRLARRGAVSRF